MNDDPSPKPPRDWALPRALRGQWTHEDNLVNHRLMWLILCEGLLFTAYGTLATAGRHWLVVGIFAALAAIEEVHRRYREAGLSEFVSPTPSRRIGDRGKLAAQALPFVFGALWLLALAGALGA